MKYLLIIIILLLIPKGEATETNSYKTVKEALANAPTDSVVICNGGGTFRNEIVLIPVTTINKQPEIQKAEPAYIWTDKDGMIGISKLKNVPEECKPNGQILTGE